MARCLYDKWEEIFLTNGFTNWKDACASFRRHETSKYHVDAVLVANKPPKNVGEMLSQAHCEQKKLNSRMLITIMQNVQYLCRQGQALRGLNDDESNLTQLLKLRSHDQPHISE